jgi:diguanylate cyclase (GGDEF)-like protein
MPVYHFSLLIQAAGTAMLLVLFLLLFQKIKRKAFADWIASWGFLLAGLVLLLLVPKLEDTRSFIFILHACLLAHVVFMLRGVRRFRDERAASSPFELLWLLPVVAVAWWTALEADALSGRAAPMALLLAAGYLTCSLAFAITPGPAAGRVLLALSFLLWGVERAIVGSAYLRFKTPDRVPELLQYSNFIGMFLEMMIGVGIIILLYEGSQARLSSEMAQLQNSDQQLREMGIRDPLTGLYNRHHFNDAIRREIANVRRYGNPLSVLIADVDRFKEINDIKGHGVGDDVLKFVANYLTACVRESDLVFRWGGDEFLILLPRTDETSGAQKAEELARRLPMIPGTGQIRPTLSVGWSCYRGDAEFPKTLADADARMYEMKLKGKRAREQQEQDLGRL